MLHTLQLRLVLISGTFIEKLPVQAMWKTFVYMVFFKIMVLNNFTYVNF